MPLSNNFCFTFGFWFLHCQRVSCMEYYFTDFAESAILAEWKSSVSPSGGKTVAPILPRGAGRRRVSAPRGKFSRGRWYISLRA